MQVLRFPLPTLMLKPPSRGSGGDTDSVAGSMMYVDSEPAKSMGYRQEPVSASPCSSLEAGDGDGEAAVVSRVYPP